MEAPPRYLRRGPDAGPALVLLDARREARVVASCSVGYRSAAVAQRLGAAGFERVYSIEGGLFQWANEGRALRRGRDRADEVHPYDRAWGRLLDPRFHAQT